MKKSSGFGLFLVFFLLVIFLHYQVWFPEDQSLFLAVFRGDPAPRFSFYPWLIESAEQFRSGHFPLWCSREGLGMPLLANYQSSPFNPFNLCFALHPSLNLLDYLLLLKLILLGIFSYLFARELGFSELSAGASSLIICFSGYVCETINQVNFNSELWVPLGLLLAEQILKGKARLMRFLLLGLTTALALLGGNPEAGFYFLLFIILYALFQGGLGKRREIFLIILGLGFGVILSSVQLMSFIEYLGFGWHIHNPNLHTIACPRWRWAFSLFYPWIFGPNRTHPSQLFMLSYLGLVPVLLALFSLVKIPALRREGLFFWSYTLVFLSVIYRIPPLDFLNYLPVMNRIASTKFAYFGVCFSIAMLSGLGLGSYLKKQISLRRSAIGLGLITVLALGSLILAYLFPMSSPPRNIIRSAWLLPLILLLISLVLIMYGNFFEEQRLISALLVFLALINLLHLYPGLAPKGKINPEQWRFKAPAVPEFLKPILDDQKINLVRLTALSGVFHHNLNLIYRVNDLRVFEGIYPKDYVRAIGEIEGFSMEEAVEQFFKHGWSFDLSERNLDHPLVGQLGVKYLISPHPIERPSWTLISSQGGYYIYQNSNYLPKVWIRFEKGKRSFYQAQMVQYQPDHLIMELRLDQPAELILTDQYAPGWRAFLWPQHRELKILKEEPLFRKVLLKPEAGVQDLSQIKQIRFYYQPRGFQIGLFSSLGSLLGWGLAISIWLLKNLCKRLRG